MDQDLKQKTQDRLTKAENILIAVSKDANFDGLASGLALFLSFEKLGKNVSILAKEPTVDDATQLYSVDKIGRLSGNENLMVVVDNAIDTVDKVTYFLDKNKLKIVVHPLSGSPGVNQNQISFEKAPVKPNVLIAIGFGNLEELKTEIVHGQFLDSDVWLINISKGKMIQKFAQIDIPSEGLSSYSEITAKFIQDFALPVNEDVSFNLYSGISKGTNNFSPTLTYPNTHQIASWLLKFGAGKANLAKDPENQQRVSKPPLQFQQPENMNEPSFAPAQIPAADVEVEKIPEKDWLKPPKIYKGGKSFDTKY